MAELRRRLRMTTPQREIYPMPVGGQSGPVIVQGGPSGSSAVRGKAEFPTKIVIKQNGKQIVGGVEKKIRKKKVKDSDKSSLRRIKNQYTELKQKAKKDIMTKKKKYYDSENKKIKELPTGERKAARKKLRAEIKKRQDSLLKQMPKSGRMKFNDVAALISKVKSIKW